MNDLLETIKQLKKEKKKWVRKIEYQKNKKTYKKYSETNKEKIKEKKKIYRLNNKEKIKEYRKTPSCYKSYKISQWKRYGVIHNDFDKLFELYVNTINCENCNILLTTKDRHNKSTTKCLDHCHISGEFRNVLCHTCNTRRR